MWARTRWIEAMGDLRRALSCLGLALVCFPSLVESCQGSDIERKPVQYSQRQGNNAISRLQKKLESGEVKWEYQAQVGYLPSLLRALDISVDSQSLVFSKTSLQRNRIAPRTPRAIYFNDDIYIGFCRAGEVLEVSVADTELGTEFYTLLQDREQPKLVRQTEDCLICHASSATQGMPGHMVRSVYVDRAGVPLLSMGSHRIDQTTPFEKRFGGWYVTGTHQGRRHLGNLILGKELEVEAVRNDEGLNRDSLDNLFDTAPYLSAKADLVAHLVLIHQTQVHNMAAKLNLETQFAMYDQRELNRELKEPIDKAWESTHRRIRSQARDLVKAILFCEEASIPKVVGGTDFAQNFSSRGPFDSRGRSLRKIRGDGRLMEYPCSYLIYSEAIMGLPLEAMEEFVLQMRAALDGDASSSDSRDEFSHLSKADKAAIREILEETWAPFQAR